MTLPRDTWDTTGIRRCIRREDKNFSDVWEVWCGRRCSWEEQCAAVVRGKLYDANCPECLAFWEASATADKVAKALS